VRLAKVRRAYFHYLHPHRYSTQVATGHLLLLTRTYSTFDSSAYRFRRRVLHFIVGRHEFLAVRLLGLLACIIHCVTYFFRIARLDNNRI
jgi:hypothetical protein